MGGAGGGLVYNVDELKTVVSKRSSGVIGRTGFG